MTRLQMVNPLTGETGLDRVFDETFAARVALQGFLADEVPHYDLAAMQDIVTAPIQAKGLALEYIGASKLGAPSRLGSL